MNPNPLFEEFPLSDQVNIEILMHRDVHFGGNFKIMLQYYEQGGKGIQPEFELERIRDLAELELSSQTNLASLLLSGAEAEKIAEARGAYKKLRALYEEEKPASSFPLLIADLILSEEESPDHAIQAIVEKKGAIVPSLLEVLKSEQFYHPLYPGYGQAPSLAAKCLGLIGDKRAIIALYEAIGQEDFFNEEILFEALKQIGEPAKEFLLTVLHGRPINFDNERAAIALIAFKDDPEVSAACLKLLLDPTVRQNLVLSTYLALACESLQTPEQRRQFLEIAQNPKTPKSLARDMQSVSANWNPPQKSGIPA